MEKRVAHHNLEEIRAEFSDPDNLKNITGSAQRGAKELLFSDEDVVKVVQSLTVKDLHKSMTSYANHRIWQDVYRPTYGGVELYVKFTCDEDGTYWLLSFKRRDEE